MTKKLKDTELKQTLDQYSKDMRKMTKIQAKQFDIARVANMISSLPERKWNAAQGVVLATIAKKDADRDLKTKKATNMLKANKRDELGAADDRRAWAETQPNIEEAETTAINAEAEMLAAKLAYECLDDLFTAGKKIMDYLVDQERATKQYDRYVNEGKKNKSR